MLKRIRTGVVISILSVFLFLVCAAIYLITTLRGAELFVRWVVPHYIQAEKFNYQQIKGNLREGIEVAAIECSNLVYFPKDNSLRIQKISIGGLQWDLNKIKILVENARISLPSSDPIILSGYFQDQTMQAHIFSKWLSIEEMMGLFHNGLGKGLQGDITQIDLKIFGSLTELTLEGDFIIDQLKVTNFLLREAPAHIQISYKKRFLGYVPKGSLTIAHGKLHAHKVDLDLDESIIRLNRELDNPELNINGHTSIRDTDIKLKILGTKNDPKLTLVSTPPLSQEKIVLMMITGTDWEVVKQSIDQQTITPELSKQLIDYFLLGGRGSYLAEKLGIKQFSITFDENTRGLGIKKKLTDNVNLGYEFKKTGDQTNSTINQEMGGEVKINKNISVSVTKEIEQLEKEGEVNEEIKEDNQILFKFKKNF